MISTHENSLMNYLTLKSTLHKMVKATCYSTMLDVNILWTNVTMNESQTGRVTETDFWYREQLVIGSVLTLINMVASQFDTLMRPMLGKNWV